MSEYEIERWVCAVCPMCGNMPLFFLAGEPVTQAFCGDDDCPVVMWDPSRSRDANLADVHPVELTRKEN